MTNLLTALRGRLATLAALGLATFLLVACGDESGPLGDLLDITGQGVWAAMAGTEDNRSIYLVRDTGSKEDAEGAALNNCRLEHHDCEIKVPGFKDGCAAATRSGGRVYYHQNPDTSNIQSIVLEALDLCRKAEEERDGFPESCRSPVASGGGPVAICS